MLLFWRIRYLDSRDRQFKDRDLYLDTATLEPVAKAAVESICELGVHAMTDRKILRFRSLFREQTLTDDELRARVDAAGSFNCISLTEYFEDEGGRELSNKRMAEILTGNSTAVMFPSYYRPHDIELCLAAPSGPVDFDRITLTQAEIDCLAYFTRDVKELRATELYQNGAGTLHQVGGSYEVKTATTPDEVRSFVTVFRRLYMTGEPGCFRNAARLFGEKVPHPTAQWMLGELADYDQDLKGKPDFYPPKQGIVATFTRKGILDAFIYTKFAHQPQKSAVRHYSEYLEQVPAEAVLSWLFLTAAHRASLHYVNAAPHIEPFLTAYLRAKNARPSFSACALHEDSGLGSVEKRATKTDRVLREKAEELAMRLWQDAGRPTGGPATFMRDAERQIRALLGT